MVQPLELYHSAAMEELTGQFIVPFIRFLNHSTLANVDRIISSALKYYQTVLKAVKMNPSTH